MENNFKFISTGIVVQSATGRNLKPAPVIDVSSDRKCINSLKRMYSWLKEEAIKECESVGNDFAKLNVENIDVKNISPSDIDTLNMVLFDKDFASLTVKDL